MAGKSPLTATDEQRAGLATLADWTSPRIAEAFGVREDTVRLWRSDFAGGGIEALKASVAPGPVPVKSETALRVATPLLEQSAADRRRSRRDGHVLPPHRTGDTMEVRSLDDALAATVGLAMHRHLLAAMVDADTAVARMTNLRVLESGMIYDRPALV